MARHRYRPHDVPARAPAGYAQPLGLAESVNALDVDRLAFALQPRREAPIPEATVAHRQPPVLGSGYHATGRGRAASKKALPRAMASHA